MSKVSYTHLVAWGIVKALEHVPALNQAFSERGDLNVLRHNLDAAARDFDQALKFNPRYGPALRGSGYCKLSAGEYQQAIELFQQSIAADPGDPQVAHEVPHRDPRR